MRGLDEQYTATPFYGIRRMTAWLRRRGYAVHHKRVGRLLRHMGLAAIYPKPRLSQPAAGHVIYPYLLRGITVSRVNPGLERRYHPCPPGGRVYVFGGGDGLVQPVYAVLSRVDHHGCRAFCVEALEQALRHGQPAIFNPDQGAQFTRLAFTERLKNGGIRISMGGRGRGPDNVFVERLWWTVKWKEVYARDYQSVGEARQHLVRYVRFYNEERPHQNRERCRPDALLIRVNPVHERELFANMDREAMTSQLDMMRAGG